MRLYRHCCNAGDSSFKTPFHLEHLSSCETLIIEILTREQVLKANSICTFFKWTLPLDVGYSAHATAMINTHMQVC